MFPSCQSLALDHLCSGSERCYDNCWWWNKEAEIARCQGQGVDAGYDSSSGRQSCEPHRFRIEGKVVKFRLFHFQESSTAIYVDKQVVSFKRGWKFDEIKYSVSDFKEEIYYCVHIMPTKSVCETKDTGTCIFFLTTNDEMEEVRKKIHSTKIRPQGPLFFMTYINYILG